MILVTGASGLVGSAIFRVFSETYKVVGTSFSSLNNDLLKIDLLDENEVNKFFLEYDFTIIIHCASIIASKNSNISSIEQYSKNIKMISNILNNISDKTKVINISGTAIYDLNGEASLDEDSVIKSETLYQLSKQHTEELLQTFYKNNNKYILNIRISSPYSTHKISDTILYKFVTSAIENNKITLWGSGERTQAFTNVDIFAIDLVSLLNKNVFGTYNYVNITKLSMKELAYKIKSFKKNIEIIFVDKIDVEDNYRTSINIDKISSIINIKSTLDEDIKYILGTVV